MSKVNYIGIDLGGTAIKMGIVTKDGTIIQKIERPTPVREGVEKVVDTFDQMTQTLFNQKKISWNDIAGVGIGIPGFVEIRTGEVIEACNLNWNHVKIKDILQEKWKLPVYVDNDANTAALGEMWVGAGMGTAHILCLTIGTGIGGGVIINGDIYHGVNGMAGELGHYPVVEKDGERCNCGKYGCFETEASATAIVRKAMKEINHYSSVQLKEAFEKNGEITAKTVTKLAEKNDPVCLKIIQDVGELIGKTLSQFCLLLNPEKIIIGGGVSYSGNLLIEPMKSSFKKHSLQRISQNTTIVQATLGNKAGLIGAAWLAHRGNIQVEME